MAIAANTAEDNPAAGDVTVLRILYRARQWPTRLVWRPEFVTQWLHRHSAPIRLRADALRLRREEK
jgi:hypothetical protein